MTGADAIAILILLTIVIAIGVYLLHWLYRHSSKNQSFVRTGVGGEKVVMGGGAFVLPIIHDITVVNMNAIPIEIRRAAESSLLTKNKMRIDVVAEFDVRVIPTEEGVSTAARSLGNRTEDPVALHEVIQGRFVDAMAAVSATLDMEDIHVNRLEYMRRVTELVEKTLGKNGLELENASLTSMNQSDISVFDPRNAFDAEGLTQLTQQIEAGRRLRNDIENETRVAIKNRDFEAEQRALEIDRDLEYARLEHMRDVERRKAQQQAEIEEDRSTSQISIHTARSRAEQESERVRIESKNAIEQLSVERAKDLHIISEMASAEQERAAITRHYAVDQERIRRDEEISTLEIDKNQKIKLAQTSSFRETEDARITADREIEEMRIAAQKYVDRFEIEQQKEVEIIDKDRLIAVINKSIEEAVAKAEEAKALKAFVKIEEEVSSARALEIADRTKRIEQIEASSRADREALRVTRQAEAEQEAAEHRAQAEVAEANASEVRYEKDAEGARKLNEAENLRSDASRRSAIYEHLVKTLPSVIRETVKPMENIESIKILQVDGVPGLNSPSESGGGDNGSGEEGGGSGSGNMTDRVVNSAMKYRTQVAFVDGLMKDLGLPLENLGSAGGMSFRNFAEKSEDSGDEK